jgi:succinoglycan biosynthesis protein ExoV
MRLYYYKDPRGNFGDDLNIWLWPKLMGGLVDTEDPYLAFGESSLTNESETLFVGVGSLLNHHIPEQPKKIVLGAGVAYGDIPNVDDKWSIYAVRGPRTADALGLDRRHAITDSGILVRATDFPKKEKTYPISFFSYHESAELIDWDGPCKSAGIHHIDPSGDVEEVLDQVMRTEVLITEAMHGAIVADALRVPWIPVKMFHTLNSFKWMDWCDSLGLEYKPCKLPTISPRINKGLKGMVRKVLRPRKVCRELRRLASTVEPILSKDQVIDDATERLLEQIEQVKLDRVTWE